MRKAILRRVRSASDLVHNRVMRREAASRSSTYQEGLYNGFAKLNPQPADDGADLLFGDVGRQFHDPVTTYRPVVQPNGAENSNQDEGE